MKKNTHKGSFSSKEEKQQQQKNTTPTRHTKTKQDSRPTKPNKQGPRRPLCLPQQPPRQPPTRRGPAAGAKPSDINIRRESQLNTNCLSPHPSLVFNTVWWGYLPHQLQERHTNPGTRLRASRSTVAGFARQRLCIYIYIYIHTISLTNRLNKNPA